ncbi:MAG: hypothetical protein SNG97_06585 [Rikenellaceae bacterium]
MRIVEEPFSNVQTIMECHFIPIWASGNRNYSTGAMNNVGTNGYYWSASPNSTTNGYNLNFNSSGVNPANNNNRSNGFQVRPVLELNKTKKNTLQDQHPRVFSRVLKL